MFEAAVMTSADVARRLGVTPGTVRHYGEELRALGFPMEQGPEGEWLWSPELVEVARVAYQVARASSPRIPFRGAVELILYAGEVAQEAREGRSLVRLARELLELPPRVEGAWLQAVQRAQDEARVALRVLVGGLESRASSVYEELSRVADRLSGAAEALQAASAISALPLLVLVLGLVLVLVVPAFLQTPMALVWFGLGLMVGGGVVWWFRG